MTKVKVLRTCHHRLQGHDYRTFQKDVAYELDDTLQAAIDKGKTEVAPVEEQADLKALEAKAKKERAEAVEAEKALSKARGKKRKK